MKQFISINWKEAKSLIESGALKVIGSNLYQINNQGEYTLSEDGTKLYKRRHSAGKAVYDLIAEKSMETKLMKIENVTESNTYKLYELLLEQGFNVSISSMFSYNYNTNERYLSIHVKDAEHRLNELYDLTLDFEVILSKYVKSDNVCFEVRRHRAFSETVTDEVWRKYYNTVNVSI